MTEQTPTLYMIPGTGTDRRMYTPQLRAFPDMVVTEWLPPLYRKESMASYAHRLSAQIDTSRPFWLGGVSLGGMLAQEMAREIKPLGLILISTCSTSKALPLRWRLQGRLTRAMPDMIVSFMMWMISGSARMLDKKRFPDRELYARMIAEMPPPLVRWQSGVAVTWKGVRKQDVPVFQLHGAEDAVIPLKRLKRPPRKVIAGGHLINVTHDGEVNAFIRDAVKG